METLTDTEGLINFDEKLDSFFNQFQKSEEPIEVSFRDLIPSLGNGDRATHLIHTYPAKLLMHIPYFFINNNILSSSGDTILDPFCGSGTVLLEANLAGRNALGADANPLARLISKVKTQDINVEIVKAKAQQIKTDLSRTGDSYFPNVVNVDHWFLPHVKKQLGRILSVIKKEEQDHYYDFLMVCFSNCIKKVSLADPRVSVPVRLRQDQYEKDHPLRSKVKERLKKLESIDVYTVFSDIIERNIQRLENCKSLSAHHDHVVSDVVSKDSRALTKSIESTTPLSPGSVNLVITSPPYAGAQKYIRSSSMNLGWLGLLEDSNLRDYEVQNIGREHYNTCEYRSYHECGLISADEILKKVFAINPLRAHIASNYIREMSESLDEMHRVMRKDAHLVLVAASNQVCGIEFQTHKYLKELAENKGFQVTLSLIDDIKSYGLMTKRNKTANIITREWVYVLRK